MTASDAALLVHANLEPVLWRYTVNVHGEVNTPRVKTFMEKCCREIMTSML